MESLSLIFFKKMHIFVMTPVIGNIKVLTLPSEQLLKTNKIPRIVQFSSVQFSHSVVSSFFLTPWTAVSQASLSITNFQSLLRLMSITSVMPSNHLICHPLLFLPSNFPCINVFTMSQLFAPGSQSIRASASVSVQ